VHVMQHAEYSPARVPLVRAGGLESDRALKPADRCQLWPHHWCLVANCNAWLSARQALVALIPTMWITPWALLLALAWSASLGGAVSRPEPSNWRSGAVRPGSGSSTVHRRSLLQADAAAGTAAAGGTTGNSEAGGRCPQLSKELLQQNAKEGTVMLAVVSVLFPPVHVDCSAWPV
jgi:hypothetical protein